MGVNESFAIGKPMQVPGIRGRGRSPNSLILLVEIGGADETRTRDLLRDSSKSDDASDEME
jgi:hypothetical protein